RCAEEVEAVAVTFGITDVGNALGALPETLQRLSAARPLEPARRGFEQELQAMLEEAHRGGYAVSVLVIALPAEADVEGLRELVRDELLDADLVEVFSGTGLAIARAGATAARGRSLAQRVLRAIAEHSAGPISAAGCTAEAGE